VIRLVVARRRGGALRRPSKGIAELEQAARLAPEDRDVCLALAQAYAAAGRTADIARARAKLLELDAKRGAR
jgi:predicted Zn-dependent protease